VRHSLAFKELQIKKALSPSNRSIKNVAVEVEIYQYEIKAEAIENVNVVN